MAKVTLAIDAMGGDNAPDMVIAGCEHACRRFPSIHLLLFGDEARIVPIIAKHKYLAGRYDLIHTDKTISPDDKPSVVARRGRGSSMWEACVAVKDGRAQAIISAGNTGALMAIAMIVLRKMPSVDRPAIISVMPTSHPFYSAVAMLDLGSNIHCNARNLVEYSLMGAAFARSVLGLPQPRVAILNVGTEEKKGSGTVQEAAMQLSRISDLPFNFTGFIEGDGILHGHADVVVTDGFTGNVTLKALEGASRLFVTFLKEALQSRIMAKIGYVFARPALRGLRERLNPVRYNGGALLGLNGLVIKSHGNTSDIGFANAIKVTINLTNNNFMAEINEDLIKLTALIALDDDKQNITEVLDE